MKDVLGNKLKVGDKVVYSLSTYCALATGIVTKICDKTLFIAPDERDEYETPDVNRHPSGVVKVK
jgi:hypothetical protein